MRMLWKGVAIQRHEMRNQKAGNPSPGLGCTGTGRDRAWACDRLGLVKNVEKRLAISNGLAMCY